MIAPLTVSLRAKGQGRGQGSGSHRDDEGVQAVAHLVRCVELSKDHSVCGRLAQVAHPELGGLEVRRVDDKLLMGYDKEVKVHSRRRSEFTVGWVRVHRWGRSQFTGGGGQSSKVGEVRVHSRRRSEFTCGGGQSSQDK